MGLARPVSNPALDWEHAALSRARIQSRSVSLDKEHTTIMSADDAKDELDRKCWIDRTDCGLDIAFSGFSMRSNSDGETCRLIPTMRSRAIVDLIVSSERTDSSDASDDPGSTGRPSHAANCETVD